MSNQGSNQSFNENDNPAPAFYLFNEQLTKLVDSVDFLAKYGDTLQVEFGDGSIFVEAITATKSACANIHFEGASIADWSYGGLGNLVDKRVLLPTKQIIGAFKNIAKNDSMTLFFCGMNCETIVIQYTNTRDIRRTYKISAREIPVIYNRRDFSPQMYANRVIATTTFFKTVFLQLNETDELSLKFYPDQLQVSKFYTQGNIGVIATIQSTFDPTAFEVYEVTVPMCITVSVREFKVALSLIHIYSLMAHVYFDIEGKPMLLTYDDGNNDLRCKILLSVADAREITDDREQELQNMVRSQHTNGITQDQSIQNGDEFMAQKQVEEQPEESDEPPLKQRKKTKSFTFEDQDENHHQDFNDVQTPNTKEPEHPSQRNESSYHEPQHPSQRNESSYHEPQQHSPPNESSEPQHPSQRNESPYQPQQHSPGYESPYQAQQHSPRNESPYQAQQHSPQNESSYQAQHPSPQNENLNEQQSPRNENRYLAALKFLGIEDQISDPEGPDAIETYDLPTSDFSETIVPATQSLHK